MTVGEDTIPEVHRFVVAGLVFLTPEYLSPEYLLSDPFRSSDSDYTAITGSTRLSNRTMWPGYDIINHPPSDISYPTQYLELV